MRKILIIEDDRIVARIYQNKFQAEGFDVTVASDGNAAILELKSNPPHIVLLDLMLPEVNGVEVLKFIRSQASIQGLPVIVLSNAYVGTLVQAAWEAGANKCLTKANCTPNNLLKEVQSALAASVYQPQPPVVAAPVLSDIESAEALLRQELHARIPSLLADLSRELLSLPRSDETGRPLMIELYRTAHALAGCAALAGFILIAQLSSALEALLNELHSKPKTISLSALRTVSQAVSFLQVLYENIDRPADELMATPLILVLDDEPMSRRTLCVALAKGNLRAVSVDEVSLALHLMVENRFDLVFLDVDMPGMNGFDVCKKLHALPANADTPVIFVTSLTDFATRSESINSGGMDLIAKPIMLIEVAVKALVHLLRGRLAHAS